MAELADVAAYQDLRGRRFTVEGQEIAWSAGLWRAAHDVRWEALRDDPPVPGDAVLAQAAERLRRANA
jgi:hypothetical protein